MTMIKLGAAGAVGAMMLLAASGSHAFVVSPPPANGGVAVMLRNSRLYMAKRPDTSPYIQAAIEASEKYGSTSEEARLAWETVEEMDAADNRFVVL